MLLLVVTILGTLAIRQGLTTLNIATSSQAQQLLLQSSDAALYRIGNASLASSSGLPTSLLGFAAQQEGNEVVFCFRGQSNTGIFDVSKASIINWNDDQTAVTTSGTTGFCDLSADGDFASNRKAQLTQIAIIMSPLSATTSSNAFDYATMGTDPTSINVKDSKRIRVYSTSFIPGLTTASNTQISTCLQKPNTEPVSGTLQTVSACLKNINVPYNTQVQDYRLDTLLCSSTSTCV